MSLKRSEEISLRLDVYGHTEDDGTIGIAVGHAKDHAVKPLGIAGAIWPLNDDAFFGVVSEALLAELIAFSIQARRVLKIKQVKDVRLQGRLWNISDCTRDIEYETELWRALNVILHANRLEVAGIEIRPTSRFEKLGDRAIAYVAATSKKDGKKLICPSAPAYGFLTIPVERL